MTAITADEKTIVIDIDPLAFKPRKNPWREKRTDFRTAGPGKPNSSAGRQFQKKKQNKKIRNLPIINRVGETVIPAIKRTVAFDLS